MSDSILAPPDREQTEPFVLSFGIKSAAEVTRDGQEGLLLEGYASRFDERDQEGEIMTRNAFSDIAETWGADPEPKVIYYHGMDHALGFRQIGKAVDWRVDDTGLYVKTFIPKVPKFVTTAAVQRFKQIYQSIKDGAIRGYSIGGFKTTFGKAIVKWSKSELSICKNPVLATATFALGTKAVKALLGDVPLNYEAGGNVMPIPMTEGGNAGVLTRPAYGQVMSMAQEHHDTALHDHLLARPAHLQGAHNSGTCAICADRREAIGMKAKDDGPDSDYLVVEPDGTTHLRVKVNGVPDHRLMGDAWAALHDGYRGNVYQGPDKAKALAKLTALYAAEKMDTPGSAGKKAIEAAEEILARYTAAMKAGARNSARDKMLLLRILNTARELLAEERAEDAEESAEPDEATAMAGKAGKVVVSAEPTTADTDGVKAAYDEWAAEHQAALHGE